MDEAQSTARPPLPAMKTGCRHWQPILKSTAEVVTNRSVNEESASEAVAGGGNAQPPPERGRR